MQVIGYLRVSSTDQDLSNCKNQILHFANEKRLGSVTWIEETVSGTVDWKQRELGKVLQQLSPG
ncbi:MAG: recombinase family protein, partial [Syntrophobacteraceae bacterium]